MKKLVTILPVISLLLLWPMMATAQEKEFEMNGYVQLQAGVFVPLTSQLFKDYDNKAFIKQTEQATGKKVRCDPVNNTTGCEAVDHGAKAGEMSMMRSVLQLEADWKATEKVNVRAVVRAVGSLKLELDKYAQPPNLGAVAKGQRRDYARDYVWETYYNDVELREFFVDIEAARWLSFRIGRQQVTWGDISSYRLLDVVNPSNTAWHFGPLEAFEDTRIPLWIVKTLLDFKDIEHTLEIVWVPGIDKDEDLVTVPLTFAGAWGLPYTNTPGSKEVMHKIFQYPGNVIEDQRIGFRWRGNIAPQSTYSLVYYYTHQLSPPIPKSYVTDPNNVNIVEKYYLHFPRQHIAGFSIDYAFDNPIGMVAKLEAAAELFRSIPTMSNRFDSRNSVFVDGEERRTYKEYKKLGINYAIQLMRPSMIRWLNPTQNILFVAQFMHSMLPTLSSLEEQILVTVPGFNDYKASKHSFTGVFVMRTTYLHGLITPGVTAAYVHPKSGFISGSLDFRLGRVWRLGLKVTDFFGADPYKAVGFFRDRDEVNLTVRAQF